MLRVGSKLPKRHGQDLNSDHDCGVVGSVGVDLNSVAFPPHLLGRHSGTARKRGKRADRGGVCSASKILKTRTTREILIRRLVLHCLAVSQSGLCFPQGTSRAFRRTASHICKEKKKRGKKNEPSNSSLLLSKRYVRVAACCVRARLLLLW